MSTYTNPVALKAEAPIDSTERGMVISDNELHDANADEPRYVTEDGITTAFNAEHPLKALLPIDATFSPIFIEGKDNAL
jgi:hypothetical protein